MNGPPVFVQGKFWNSGEAERFIRRYGEIMRLAQMVANQTLHFTFTELKNFPAKTFDAIMIVNAKRMEMRAEKTNG